MKKNCWEFFNCGCEPGGSKTKEFGVCPASTESVVNGVNNGKNGGRSCWAVPGTLCEGVAQRGPIEQKLFDCLNCAFYKQTVEEEFGSANYKSPNEIVRMFSVVG